MHTILVPVDGSDHALKALHIACDLAEKYGGRLALLHVLAEGRSASQLLELASANTFGRELTAALRQAAEKPAGRVGPALLKAVGAKILGQASARAGRRNVEVKILEMEQGEPAEAILVAQKRTGAGTIVMGCRGVGASNDSSFGSVSHRVFEKAGCTCVSVK